jgi:hypothetical protein
MTASIPGTMSDRAAIDVRDVREDIRKAVEADARERDSSMNDVVGEILARRYGYVWTPSGYPYTDGTESTQWLLRVPGALRDSIRDHAKGMPSGTMRGVIMAALAQHYGLPVESPRKRSRSKLTPELIIQARREHADGVSIRELSRRMGIKRETLTKAIREAT